MSTFHQPIVLSGYGATIFVLENDFMDKWIDKYGYTPQGKVRDIRFEGRELQKSTQEVNGIKIPVTKIVSVPRKPNYEERLAAANAECEKYKKEEQEYILNHLFEDSPYEYYEMYCNTHSIELDRLKCDPKAYDPHCDLTCSLYLECRGKRLGGE